MEMDQIWKQTPYDVVRHVISFMDDIDVRRAFGFKPRKLSKSDLDVKLYDSIILYGNYHMRIGIYIVQKCPDTERVTVYCKNKLVSTLNVT
jgi:hypothetical protein